MVPGFFSKRKSPTSDAGERDAAEVAKEKAEKEGKPKAERAGAKSDGKESQKTALVPQNFESASPAGVLKVRALRACCFPLACSATVRPQSWLMIVNPCLRWCLQCRCTSPAPRA